MGLNTERKHNLVLSDLHERTRQLLTQVRKPTDDEREVLEKKLGYVVLSTQPRSLDSAIAEDPGYFWEHQEEYLDEELPRRRPYEQLVPFFYVPPVPFFVGIHKDPEQRYIPGSFNETPPRRFDMAEEYSRAVIEQDIPNAKVILLPAVTLVDLDKELRKMPETAGQYLFQDRFTQALDQYEFTRSIYPPGRLTRLIDPMLVSKFSGDFKHGFVPPNARTVRSVESIIVGREGSEGLLVRFFGPREKSLNVGVLSAVVLVAKK